MNESIITRLLELISMKDAQIEEAKKERTLELLDAQELYSEERYITARLSEDPEIAEQIFTIRKEYKEKGGVSF